MAGCTAPARRTGMVTLAAPAWAARVAADRAAPADPAIWVARVVAALAVVAAAWAADPVAEAWAAAVPAAASPGAAVAVPEVVSAAWAAAAATVAAADAGAERPIEKHTNEKGNTATESGAAMKTGVAQDGSDRCSADRGNFAVDPDPARPARRFR
jgi:hypothetical protein